MKRFVAMCILIVLAVFFMSNRNVDKTPGNGQTDGPYVIYKKDKVYAYSIVEDNGTYKLKIDSSLLSQKESIKLNVATDKEDISFGVTLKKELENEKTDFSGVNKMFVVSDIEGEFKAFRQLLQGNNVIDENSIGLLGMGILY